MTVKPDPVIDPSHEQVRGVLRWLGPLLLATGLAFLAVGVFNFFSSFGTMEPPRYFWCAFVGIPLLGIGAALTRFGYLGAMLRYMAGEVSPVGRDTFNSVAEGTRPGVEAIARAVGEGWRAAGESNSRPCSKCQASNATSARFCNQCGAPLGEHP
jgi:hypothetical protein